MHGQGDTDGADTDQMKRSRIFVGGLGVAVTAGDLEKTFSSLGQVHEVEIIRTNGRSFAYMDFEPASQKDLNKLFSLYNGCMWKGGRLKLEKAKEHYLDRLHREWAADAAQLETITDGGDIDTPSKVDDRKTIIMPEKSGLKIFFPRQKKVKVLVSKGMGKHKYSFQRIESLPVSQLSLCSCEEHNMHLKEDGNNVVDLDNTMADTGGLSEKELNIMKTVMERLIGDEEQKQTATELSNKTQTIKAYKHGKWGQGKARIDMKKFDDEDDTEGVIDSEVTVKILDKLATDKKAKTVCKEEKELKNTEKFRQESDPVVKDTKDGPNLSSVMMQMTSTDANELPSTEAEFKVAKLRENDFKPEIRSRIPHKKTSYSPKEVKIDRKLEVLEPQVSKRLKIEDNIFSSIQETRNNSNIDIGQDMEDGTSPKGHENGRPSQVQGSARSWVQKASWKELVGQTGRVSFSLSSIMGGAGSSPNLIKCKDTETSGPHENKEINRRLPDESGKNVTQDGLKSSNIEGSRSIFGGEVVEPQCSESVKTEPITGMKKVDDTGRGQEVPKETFVETEVQDKKCNIQVDKDLQLSGTVSPAQCTFMRSENAEAEWLKNKAVARGCAKTRRKVTLKSIKRLGVAPARF